MSSRPWMKFYPSDWRSDPALRMCSIAARGLWMEMICLAHEGTPRGTVSLNGRPMSSRDIAALSGVSEKECRKLLSELERAGVFDCDDAGVIYSRRMMRDEEKASKDKANGKKGGNPKLRGGVNPHDNPPHNRSVNGRDKAHIPEARSQKEIPSQREALTSQDRALSGVGFDEANPFGEVIPFVAGGAK
jgi:hypothetical protein